MKYQKLKQAIIEAVPNLLKQTGENDWEFTRPITLANVLIAFTKNKLLYTVEHNYTNGFVGLLIGSQKKVCGQLKKTRIKWNLTKTFDDQKTEAKDFLNKLLVK